MTKRSCRLQGWADPDITTLARSRRAHGPARDSGCLARAIVHVFGQVPPHAWHASQFRKGSRFELPHALSADAHLGTGFHQGSLLEPIQPEPKSEHLAFARSEFGQDVLQPLGQIGAFGRALTSLLSRLVRQRLAESSIVFLADPRGRVELQRRPGGSPRCPQLSGIDVQPTAEFVFRRLAPEVSHECTFGSVRLTE